jgi:hypothetical protein
MSDKLCIVFVCQAGELELKGLLLAASLRENANFAAADMVAAIPDPEIWGHLSESAERLIRTLNLRKEIIESPFGKEYPIGNKLVAIGVKTQAPVTVFIDSDILCLHAIQDEDLVTQNLRAKPADLNTYQGSLAQWERAYAFIDQDLPSERVLSTVSQELMLPYFNAGLVAVRDGHSFSKCWLDIAKQIDACEHIEHKRPWLDQVALPVAAKALGYEYEVLSETFNYPAHLKALNPNKLPALCHYHSPSVVIEEPALCRLVASLCAQYPDLKALLERHEPWRDVLVRGAKVESPTRATSPVSKLLSWLTHNESEEFSFDTNQDDFLITGLPRSGTSLLCNLLHKAPNLVVVNEPQEVFDTLKADSQALGLGLLYRKLRSNIELGKGIYNKVNEDGDVIEDTRFNDTRRHYQPKVLDTRFKLATKNPLAYLSRLRVLCDAYPDMPKVVMIRHPLDVIYSWKASFEHLKSIDLAVIPFAGEHDPMLDGVQHRLLNSVRKQTYLPVRRALYFNYLAEMIARDKERICVIRYEDLLANSTKVMNTVATYVGMMPMQGQVLESIRPSSSQKIFDIEDVKAVEMLCGDFLREWGYI